MDRSASDGRVHVVHVFGGLGPGPQGGTERQAVALIRGCDPREYRHTAISDTPIHAPIARDLAGVGCPTLALPARPGKTPAYVARLARLLRRLAPDIVHTWLDAPGFWGRAAAVLAGAPAIVASSRTMPDPTRLWEPWLDRLLSRATAARIANSEAVRDGLVARIGLPAGSVDVIPNGLETGRLRASGDRASCRLRLGLPTDAHVVLAIGRLVPEKDHATLIRAAGELAPAFPNLRLLVAGGGRLADALEDLARAGGLSGVVSLLGPRDDVGDLLAAADVFVLPSRTEGSPNALLEAMWCGVPVAASRLPATEEWVRDGVTGRLADVGDAPGLAKVVADLLSDRTVALRLAAAAETRVRALTLESMVARHEAVYRRAVRGSSLPECAP